MAPVLLAAGEHVVLAAADAGGCVVLPAGSNTSEYVVALLSGSGLQLPSGVSGPASIRAQGLPDQALRALPPAPRGRHTVPDAATDFHLALRAREAALAARPRARAPAPARAVAPPVVGAQRVFQVCATTNCATFVSVTATARAVGTHAAIYLDDTVPEGGFTDPDLVALSELFDQGIFAVDTAAFGRETDLDGNGVVAVLLTDAVNALSGSCNSGVILGYFFGLDLEPGQPGSNGGEVLYSRVPDASTPACRADPDRVRRTLPPNLIHELQHLLNYGQRVVLRGDPVEHVWLNEGLSHFAEELGGRLIPDGPLQGGALSREAQFLELDLNNAMDYLADPASSFLVTPGGALGSSPERGAQWLFVRWLGDQLAPGDVRATALTRALVASREQGAENVAGRAGVPFRQLVGEWQLANYLDNLPGFGAATDRLQYRSINLRATLAQLYPVFPLRPDSAGSAYLWNGQLRGGSGHHLRIVLPPGAGRFALLVTRDPEGTAAPEPLLDAVVAIARVR